MESPVGERRLYPDRAWFAFLLTNFKIPLYHLSE